MSGLGTATTAVVAYDDPAGSPPPPDGDAADDRPRRRQLTEVCPPGPPPAARWRPAAAHRHLPLPPCRGLPRLAGRTTAHAAAGGAVLDATPERFTVVTLVTRGPGHVPGAHNALGAVLDADSGCAARRTARPSPPGVTADTSPGAIACCGSGVSARQPGGHGELLPRPGSPVRGQLVRLVGRPRTPRRDRPSHRHRKGRHRRRPGRPRRFAGRLRRSAARQLIAWQPDWFRGGLSRLHLRHPRRCHPADQRLGEGRHRHRRRPPQRRRPRLTAPAWSPPSPCCWACGVSGGGPLALEAADVAHVMLAPIDRRQALARPAVSGCVPSCLPARRQRDRNQLAGRRLRAASSPTRQRRPAHRSSAGGWPRPPRPPCGRWAATVVGLALVAWQTGARPWHPRPCHHAR